MVKISELKVMEDVLFRKSINYTKKSFYPFILKTFTENKAFNSKTMEKIDKIIEDSEKDKFAHNVLINRDMRLLKGGVNKEFDSEKWISLLPEIKKQISKHMELDFEIRDIKFVENFPENLKSMELKGASAITVFENNDKKGIYFLNKRVDNVSTPIHIIHEQIHTCLSQNKGEEQIFVEWFEEGVAILYSLLIYYELTHDFETLNAYRTRSYVYSKVKPEWDFTKRYFEYMN